MLGLRKTNGISINTFKNKYNKDIFKVFPNLEVLIKQKFIKKFINFFLANYNFSF